MKNPQCYIEYLDCKNRFRKTKKEFTTYDEAKKWMLGNLEKPNTDYIKFN